MELIVWFRFLKNSLPRGPKGMSSIGKRFSPQMNKRIKRHTERVNFYYSLVYFIFRLNSFQQYNAPSPSISALQIKVGSLSLFLYIWIFWRTCCLPCHKMDAWGESHETAVTKYIAITRYLFHRKTECTTVFQLAAINKIWPTKSHFAKEAFVWWTGRWMKERSQGSLC